jgi:serine phosphatase RsbU (regulator of sigma subunit)
LSHKVLIVDDDAKILAALRRRLRKRFTIETVMGGSEGLEKIRTDGPFAVVVADYCMPRMNGVEFLSRVRKVSPDAVRMMLTGSGDLQSAARAVNEGNIFRFLTKPCSIDVLSEALDSGIEEFRRANVEREFNQKTRHRLAQAMEVQQNLVPSEEALVEGLDIAGHSVYCDETSGDYYDYFKKEGAGDTSVGIVVGDVSDHGVPSALLMTAARAFLRERAARSGSASDIISDVNRQLARDMKTSGMFMTLFYCEVDAAAKNIVWVRAGHDPAIVYNPADDEFSELSSHGGLPLGVFEDSAYEEYSRNIGTGQIILIGTDGIWEARNDGGEIFGKERIKKIMRSEAHRSAKQITLAILERFEQFLYPQAPEDDATLVVLKLL